MNKIIIYFFLCICGICTSCQSSDEVIINAVNQVNSSCPITISKETITKVEYVNHEIIFHIAYDESEGSFEDITYQDLKRLESNQKFNKQTIKELFSQEVVKEAFKDVSLKVAEDIDLRLKAILKGNTSELEVVCKMSWRDALHNL